MKDKMCEICGNPIMKIIPEHKFMVYCVECWCTEELPMLWLRLKNIRSIIRMDAGVILVNLFWVMICWLGNGAWWAMLISFVIIGAFWCKLRIDGDRIRELEGAIGRIRHEGPNKGKVEVFKRVIEEKGAITVGAKYPVNANIH